MKQISTKYNEYQISNFCGDCISCEDGCETGASIMANNDWTSEDVERACSLLLEGLNTEIIKAMGVRK